LAQGFVIKKRKKTLLPTMKVVATVLALATGLNLKLKMDPHCSKGMMNVEMTACCQADCGECSDTSDVCKIANGEGRGGEDDNGRGSTCCPAIMLATDNKLPSCDNSMAPCAIPDAVRNPADVASLTAADRVAADDCNEAIPATKAQHHASTAYIAFKGKSCGAATTECGTFSTIVQASAACSGDDGCLGFTTAAGEDSVTCLLVAGAAVESLSDDTGADTYLKREDGTGGHIYHFTTTEWSACSEECGGGTQTRSMGCASEGGDTVVVGLCSSLTGVNADATPSESADCNPQQCTENA